MHGQHKVRGLSWHPSPENMDWLKAEVERRGGGRGVQSAILDEALALYRKTVRAEQEREEGE